MYLLGYVHFENVHIDFGLGLRVFGLGVQILSFGTNLFRDGYI